MIVFVPAAFLKFLKRSDHILLPVGVLFFFLIKLLKILVIFWAVLGLCCYAQVFSSCGAQASHCSGFSSSGTRALERRLSTRVVVHGPSCSVARGVLPNQGPNPCPLHCKMDS